MGDLDEQLVAACLAELTDRDPDHEWDVAAGYPFDDPRYPHAVRGARLGDGRQPFLVIYGAAPGYPEEAVHLARLAAICFVRTGEDFDRPQLVLDRAALCDLPYRLDAWAAQHGH